MKHKRLITKDDNIYKVVSISDEFIAFADKNDEEFTLPCRTVLMFILDGKLTVIGGEHEKDR